MEPITIMHEFSNVILRSMVVAGHVPSDYSLALVWFPISYFDVHGSISGKKAAQKVRQVNVLFYGNLLQEIMHAVPTSVAIYYICLAIIFFKLACLYSPEMIRQSVHLTSIPRYRVVYSWHLLPHCVTGTNCGWIVPFVHNQFRQAA